MFGLDTSDSENSPVKQRPKAETPASKAVFPLFSQSTAKESPAAKAAASPAAKPSKTPKPPKTSPGLAPKRSRIDRDSRQQLLDFGQKDFGPIECLQCGMFYEPRHGDDVDRHNAHHKALTERFSSQGSSLSSSTSSLDTSGSRKAPAAPKSPFPTPRGTKLSESVTERWKAAGLLLPVRRLTHHSALLYRCWDAADHAAAPLHPSHHADLAKLRAHIDKVVEGVNEELGYLPSSTDELWRANRSVYVLVSAGHTLVGVAVVDWPVPDGAHLVFHKPNDDAKDAADVASPRGNICVRTEVAYEVDCGVQRVWVAPSQRRRGLGLALLRCVAFEQRRRLGKPPLISAKRVGFTEPTEAGKVLMAKFCDGLHNVLIYDPRTVPQRQVPVHVLLRQVAQPPRTSSPLPGATSGPRTSSPLPKPSPSSSPAPKAAAVTKAVSLVKTKAPSSPLAAAASPKAKGQKRPRTPSVSTAKASPKPSPKTPNTPNSSKTPLRRAPLRSANAKTVDLTV